MKPFFIAHAANNLKTLQHAFDSGCDFAEIDVWKAPLRRELTVKHAGIPGGLGFGQKLKDFLTPQITKSVDGRLYFDFKWGAEGGMEKLIKFLKSRSLSNFIVSSTDWYALLWASKNYKITPHFTISNAVNLKIFKHLYKKFRLDGPRGISIRASFLTTQDAQEFKKNNIETVVWTVNSKKDVEKIVKMDVWGIVTSAYSQIEDFKKTNQ